MDEVHDLVLADDQFNMYLFAAFAAMALLLAGLGIYGVMSFTVAQRSREIALRIALGSTRGQVVGLVVREGMRMTLAGLGAYGRVLRRARPCWPASSRPGAPRFKTRRRCCGGSEQ